ncbi:peptidylprolyl isomerase [Hansschlegelia beijingensis]
MRILLAFLVALGFATVAQAAGPAPSIVMETTKGTVTIRLRPDLAPNHVARIEQLVRDKFYDGVPFHRVIAGFMAQTGDPTGTGEGGSKYPDLKAEFSKESFKRGTVGMARTADPDTANSQFFICFGPASWLDGQYTIIGEVTSGMDVVDKLKKGAAGSGTVQNPDKVKSIRLADGPA